MSRACAKRPPGRAVAHHEDAVRQQGVADEVVEHDVGAQPRGEAERRRVAHRHRDEVVVGHVDEVGLDAHLRLGVGGHRPHRRLLVEDVLGARRPVHRARGGVDEARDAGVLRQAGEARRGVVVDVVGVLGRQRPQRVVRQRGEVHDGVEPAQLLGGDVAQVHGQRGRLGGGQLAEDAVGVEAGVEPGDLVARLGEHRCHEGAEVALVAGEQDAHRSGPSFEWFVRQGDDGTGAPEQRPRQVEALRVAHPGLHPADAGEAREGLVVEPGAGDLGRVVLVEQAALLRDDLGLQGPEQRRLGEVGLGFEDLVAERQVVAEDRGDETGEAAVVLVVVAAVPGEHEVGLAGRGGTPRAPPWPTASGGAGGRRACPAR